MKEASAVCGGSDNLLNLSRSSTEVNVLVQQNTELNEGLAVMQDEVHYLRLREKKIMYLVHLLQSRGYPVTQVFEQQIKPIQTLRFDEFLQQKEADALREEQLNALVEFSFHTDDSFAPLVSGPQIRPKKPDEIPDLLLHDLPEYVTSSDEEDGPQSADPPVEAQPHTQTQTVADTAAHYDESMKYIE